MIRTIGCCYDNEIGCEFERVEFLEELRDFFCLVGIDIVRTSGYKRIYLIEKEDNWFILSGFLGSFEEILDILGCLMKI
jgi:hypothetical protein